jgi:hypothetical protein
MCISKHNSTFGCKQYHEMNMQLSPLKSQTNFKKRKKMKRIELKIILSDISTVRQGVRAAAKGIRNYLSVESLKRF